MFFIPLYLFADIVIGSRSSSVIAIGDNGTLLAILIERRCGILLNFLKYIATDFYLS